MTFWRLAPLCAATLALMACSPEASSPKVSEQLAKQILVPAYQAWTQSDQALAQSAKAFCQGEQTLVQAQQSFSQAQQRWAALQPLLIGPLAEGNQAWQVQFWPDKKDLVSRQVEALLKRYPNLNTADLAKASVAVKGLSAYEYVLFDQRLDLNDAAQKSRYCPLLVAVAEHQAALSDKVLSQWQAPKGMQENLSLFPNALYADEAEATAELLRVQVNAIDGLKKKLGAPMGKQTKGVPQPFQADAWRSQASLTNLAAALTSAQALWQGSQGSQGIGFKSLVPEAQQELASRIDQAYSEILSLLAAQTQPLTELLKSPEGRERLNEIYDSLNRLHRLHESELAQALGITLGFNAHDGD